MEEAKKMMGNPEFQKQMKMMEKSDEFKSAAEKAKTMMDDPTESARVQAQMEHMVSSSNDYYHSIRSGRHLHLLSFRNLSKKIGEAWSRHYTERSVIFNV